MAYICAQIMTSDFSVTDGSYFFFLIDCTEGNVAVSLGDANNINGYPYLFKKMDTSSHVVTITPVVTGQTIDNETSYQLGTNDFVTLYAINNVDVPTWYTIN